MRMKSACHRKYVHNKHNKFGIYTLVTNIGYVFGYILRIILASHNKKYMFFYEMNQRHLSYGESFRCDFCFFSYFKNVVDNFGHLYVLPCFLLTFIVNLCK